MKTITQTETVITWRYGTEWVISMREWRRWSCSLFQPLSKFALIVKANISITPTVSKRNSSKFPWFLNHINDNNRHSLGAEGESMKMPPSVSCYRMELATLRGDARKGPCKRHTSVAKLVGLMQYIVRGCITIVDSRQIFLFYFKISRRPLFFL